MDRDHERDRTRGWFGWKRMNEREDEKRERGDQKRVGREGNQTRSIKGKGSVIHSTWLMIDD